jgi:hypothetical protein
MNKYTYFRISSHQYRGREQKRDYALYAYGLLDF